MTVRPVLPDQPGRCERAPAIASIGAREAARRAAFLLVGVAAVCWAVIALFGAFPGDAQTEDEVREQALGPAVVAVAHALAWIGILPVAVGLTVVIALIAANALGRRYAVLAVATLGANIVTVVLKALVGRPRPAAQGLVDSSFPSGHTAFATSVIGFAALLAAYRRRWAAAAACLAVIGAMGPSRVVLGVHWLSDVVAGYAIGGAWLLGVLLVGLPWARRGEQDSDLGS